jgi:MFS family permease
MRYLLASTFLVSLAMGMVGLALPLYAKDLGASYTEIGLLGVAFVVFGILVSVPSGRLADRYGRKPFILLSLFSTSCVFVLYSYAGAVIWLLALRLVQGMTEMPLWINAQAAVADLTAPAIRGKAIGAYGTSWGSGFAVGPLLGGLLYKSVGPTLTFLLGAAVAFTSAAVMMGSILPKPEIGVEKVRLKSLLPACYVGLIYMGVVAVIFTLFPAYAKDMGMSASQIGVLLTLFAAMRAILFIPLGGLSDKLGYRLIILLGMLGLVIASVFLAIVTSYFLFAWAILFLAVAEGAIYPAMMSMVSGAAGIQNRGYVLGVFNMILLIGWGLLPGIGGVLADVVSPNAPYFMCAFVALGALILFWKLLPRKGIAQY